MWEVKREKKIGPRRWSWVAISTAYGAIMGNAWTKRQAYKRLEKAERKLYSE